MLTRQQQMYPDRAADSADRDQEINEIRLGRQQLAELVDHDEQMRQRLKVRPLRAQLAIVTDGRNRASIAKQLLATYHLAIDARPGSFSQLRIIGEVVDDSGHM